MNFFQKKLLKILAISLILSIVFYSLIIMIQKYVSGGLASDEGFPFRYYYNYWFAPGIEFECPILMVIDFIIIFLFFTIIGVIYYLIIEKDKQIKSKFTIVLSIMILFIIVFTTICFFICPFPDLSNLPEPGEYVSGSAIKFLQDDTQNTLTVAEVSNSNIKWNDTTIMVNGNALVWDSNLRTWNYGNIEIISSTLSNSSIDDIDLLDYIANCSGIVTITYNPTQVTFGTWEFE